MEENQIKVMEEVLHHLREEKPQFSKVILTSFCFLGSTRDAIRALVGCGDLLYDAIDLYDQADKVFRLQYFRSRKAGRTHRRFGARTEDP